MRMSPVKFWEHFIYIANAMNSHPIHRSRSGMNRTSFFYDYLTFRRHELSR